MDQVYALAADMGGMGFISGNHSRILLNNALINFHTLDAAQTNGVKRYLYTSSACVYPEYQQTRRQRDAAQGRGRLSGPAAGRLRLGEADHRAAVPRTIREDYGIETRIVRFHNIFGPLGTWDGGREKAPAAMCRKVAMAKLTGHHEIEIWGDGEQTRSFCYIDDCVVGIDKLMTFGLSRAAQPGPGPPGDDQRPGGHDRPQIAGVKIRKKHIPGPQGVRGRNSDNIAAAQGAGLGAADFAGGGDGADLRLD